MKSRVMLQCLCWLLVIHFMGAAAGAAEPQQPLWRYAPDNVVVFGSMRVQDVLKSEIYTRMRQRAPEACKKAEQQLSAEFGVPLEQIEVMQLIGGLVEKRQHPCLAIVLNQPRTADEVRNAIKGGKAKVEDEQIAGHTMYRYGATQVFSLPEAKLMLVSEDFALRPILERGADAAGIEAILATLTGADLKSSIVWAGSMKQLTKQQRAAMIGEDDMLAPFLKTMEQFVVEVKVTDQLQATAKLHYADADTANKIKTNMQQFIDVVKVIEGTSPALKNVLDTAKITSEGPVVIIKGQMSADDLISLIPENFKPGS